ncbi:DUF2069 domain-containing protein [Aeromonas sp. 2692-1]|uniref:DUF2069 domain-containing protein n=1 Tax=Aeromonas sp. 2692-1 TaxID=2560029 RepID=UPI00148AEFB3|nr:DUF2069 domain-containing protein [Aeromonas sp. 2692-1]QJT13837.1 DUF2069 domain-containing protein [Aeromonas sp. 2692-1]
MSTRFARLLTLVGFFGLLGWVILWHLWLSPHPDLNPWLLPVIWTVPLLFPLKGIVQGNPYTHAWGNFVLMPYFLHALTLITTDEGERWLAVVELVFTVLAFIGTIYYARLRGRELSLSIRKKKGEPSAQDH